MKINPIKIEKMLQEVEQMIDQCKKYEKNYEGYLAAAHPDLMDSAKNLVHYLALRSHDLRELQKLLGNLGMSRLAKAEAHVMESLLSTKKILMSLVGQHTIEQNHPPVTIKKSKKILRKRNKELFGYKSKKRRVRIMVTQPVDAAFEPHLALGLMRAGMNTVRVNCAHDGPTEWNAMIAHAKAAMKKVGRTCKITMDLGGPKIRTGAIVPGPKVVHLSPERNTLGTVINPARAGLIPLNATLPDDLNSYIPVPQDWLSSLQLGDRINFRDTRNKNRQLKIAAIEENVVWVNAYDACYIQTGTFMKKNNDPESVAVGEMIPKEQAIILKPGDVLILHKDKREGELAEYNEDGALLKTAHISCTSGQVFRDVKVGEPVFFDDGKIEGIIRENDGINMHIEITYAKEMGTKLKADKGINLPKSQLQIAGLTEKDREDLKFVAAHANVVNMSFVNSKEDVQDLIHELEQLNAKNKLGIILKIETQQAFDSLPEILLTAMQVKPIGVMIARGDLAIECGWENVGRIQEEILWMCEAAHIPTVWATQVLENLAKKGLPSRAEITDAVMAQRADCVMLNKGPYITRAISMLDSILSKMQEYQDKKAAMLPALTSVLSKESNPISENLTAESVT